MITILLLLYVVLGLSFIIALAFVAAIPTPKKDRDVELLKLLLRTELRSKPAIWQMEQMDKAA